MKEYPIKVDWGFAQFDDTERVSGIVLTIPPQELVNSIYSGMSSMLLDRIRFRFGDSEGDWVVQYNPRDTAEDIPYGEVRFDIVPFISWVKENTVDLIIKVYSQEYGCNWLLSSVVYVGTYRID